MPELTGLAKYVFAIAYAWFLAQAKVALLVEQARREVPDGKFTSDTLDAILARPAGALGGSLPPAPAGDPGQPTGSRAG